MRITFPLLACLLSASRGDAQAESTNAVAFKKEMMGSMVATALIDSSEASGIAFGAPAGIDWRKAQK